MSTTSVGVRVATLPDWEDQFLRQSTSRMKRGVRRMPKGFQDFFRDLTRSQPRSKSYFSHIPTVADAVVSAGVKQADVLAPLFAEETRIVAKHFSANLPSVQEVNHGEENTNHSLNHLQIEVAEEIARTGKVSRTTAQKVVDACNDQVVETKRLAAVVLRECAK